MSQQKPRLFSLIRTTQSAIYSSGVVSTPGDAPTQIRGCFEKLKGLLLEAGLTMKDIVKVNVYLADISDREKHLNQIWVEYFPANPPCRTTVQANLGGPLVEIEIVAEAKQ